MSEEKSHKALLSKELRKAPVKTNLILKFRKVFTLPICLGILFNIIVTIFFLLNFSSNLINNEQLTSIIGESERERNKPIIENVGNILYKKFQPAIYSLNSFKRYIQKITSEDFLDLREKSQQNNNIDRQKMESFIQKYSINLDHYYEAYDSVYNRIKDNIYDYSTWFIDHTKTKTSDLTHNELKTVYLVVNLNLLFRSHFQLYKTSNFTGFTKIYGGFESNSIYFNYPLPNTPNINDTNLDVFQNFKNPSDCRDENFKIPNYFYFKCRPWYRETIALNKQYKFPITITYPYMYASSTPVIGVSACIKIDYLDYFGIEGATSSEEMDFVIMCIDLPLIDIISVFDYLNNMINGYFFVLRVNSEKPIYYPQQGQDNILNTLVKYEFDKDTDYYIDDLIDFKHDKKYQLLNQISFDNSTKNDLNKQIFVSKNGVKYIYEKIPISLNFADSQSEKGI